jgi:glc operon protein GlcG
MLWHQLGKLRYPFSALISSSPFKHFSHTATSLYFYSLAEAKARKFKDISVFVVDCNGRVIVSKTQIGCPRLNPSIALGKAGAAIGTHSSSRALKDKYTLSDRTPQLLAMTTISDSNKLPFIAVPGGVLCRDEHGIVVGAIGVSGASADEDEHCAVIGAQICGFVTEPATSPLK